MIVKSLCNTCFQPFQLLLQASDANLMKELMDNNGLADCPRLCGGKINLIGEPPLDLEKNVRLKEPMHLTGKQVWVAVQGAGLPDEIPQDPTVVESLLKANQVVGVELERWGEKLFLHELHLENGVVVHLTGGVKGAQVLKLTKAKEN